MRFWFFVLLLAVCAVLFCGVEYTPNLSSEAAGGIRFVTVTLFVFASYIYMIGLSHPEPVQIQLREEFVITSARPRKGLSEMADARHSVVKTPNIFREYDEYYGTTSQSQFQLEGAATLTHQE